MDPPTEPGWPPACAPLEKSCARPWITAFIFALNLDNFWPARNLSHILQDPDTGKLFENLYPVQSALGLD